MAAQDEYAERGLDALERLAAALERIAVVLEDNTDRQNGRFNVGGVIVTREDRP